MFLCVLLAELRIPATIARARLADHWAFVVWTLQPKHLLVGWQGCGSSAPGCGVWRGSMFLLGPTAIGSRDDEAQGTRCYQRGPKQELREERPEPK